jgi:hypothetical protein
MSSLWVKSSPRSAQYRFLNHIVIILLCGLAGVGCHSEGGGDDATDDVADTTLPESDAGVFCQSWASAACLRNQCFTGWPDDVLELCRAQLEVVCEAEVRPNKERLASEGAVVWNELKEAACFAEALAEVCTLSTGEAPTSCEGLVTGLRSEGEPCENINECEAGLTCDLESGCPGTCQRAGGDGERCGYYDRCDRGLRCAPTEERVETPTMRCEPDPCGSGCSGDEFCDETGCTSKRMDGETCSGAAECEDGLACSWVDGARRCVAPSGQGDACTLTNASRCGDGLVCRALNAGTGTTCEVPALELEYCEPWMIGISSTYSPCASGLTCRSDHCERPPGVGESCADGWCGHGNFGNVCWESDRRCHAPARPGEACAARLEVGEGTDQPPWITSANSRSCAIGYCNAADGEEGICVLGALSGEACTPANEQGPKCAFGSCVESVCTVSNGTCGSVWSELPLSFLNGDFR